MMAQKTNEYNSRCGCSAGKVEKIDETTVEWCISTHKYVHRYVKEHMHFTQKSLERSEKTCKKNAMQDTLRGLK